MNLKRLVIDNFLFGYVACAVNSIHNMHNKRTVQENSEMYYND